MRCPTPRPQSLVTVTYLSSFCAWGLTPVTRFDVTDTVASLATIVGTVQMLHALLGMLEQVLDEFRHVIGAVKHSREPLSPVAWRPIEVRGYCLFPLQMLPHPYRR